MKKKKKCKICKEEFTPYYTSLQPTCFNSDCVLKHYNNVKEAKQKKEKRNKRTTHSDVYVKENKSDYVYFDLVKLDSYETRHCFSAIIFYICANYSEYICRKRSRMGKKHSWMVGNGSNF